MALFKLSLKLFIARDHVFPTGALLPVMDARETVSSACSCERAELMTSGCDVVTVVGREVVEMIGLVSSASTAVIWVEPDKLFSSSGPSYCVLSSGSIVGSGVGNSWTVTITSSDA